MTARIVVVTGTDTGVGKTIATAAIAARAAGNGQRVLVVKPVQTGIGGSEPDIPDVDTIAHLAGVDTVQFVALDEPLAPDTASLRQGVAIPTVREHVRRIRDLASPDNPDDAYDLVIVEGAGGLLVRLDSDGGTLLDIARDLTFSLRRRGTDDVVSSPVEVVIVVRAGLGTLNHTELTTTALRAVQIEPASLIIGSWPSDPGVAETCNRTDLTRLTGVPVLGAIPADAGELSADDFRAGAAVWLSQP